MTICVTIGDKNSLRKLVSDADISAASLGRSLGRLHSVEHTLEESNRVHIGPVISSHEREMLFAGLFILAGLFSQQCLKKWPVPRS